jgi:hypothetical protein
MPSGSARDVAALLVSTPSCACATPAGGSARHAHRLGAHRATGLVVDATEAGIGGAPRRGHGPVVDETDSAVTSPGVLRALNGKREVNG